MWLLFGNKSLSCKKAEVMGAETTHTLFEVGDSQKTRLHIYLSHLLTSRPFGVSGTGMAPGFVSSIDVQKLQSPSDAGVHAWGGLPQYRGATLHRESELLWPSSVPAARWSLPELHWKIMISYIIFLSFFQSSKHKFPTEGNPFPTCQKTSNRYGRFSLSKEQKTGKLTRPGSKYYRFKNETKQKQVPLENENNSLQPKYITARNRKCMFSTRSKVRHKHEDVEGKTHEDRGGLYGNESQTCKLKPQWNK